jgi:hypothetical protein
MVKKMAFIGCAIGSLLAIPALADQRPMPPRLSTSMNANAPAPAVEATAAPRFAGMPDQDPCFAVQPDQRPADCGLRPGLATEDDVRIVFDEARYNTDMRAFETQSLNFLTRYTECHAARVSYQSRTFHPEFGWSGWSGWNGSMNQPTQAECNNFLLQIGSGEPDISNYIQEIPVTVTYQQPVQPQNNDVEQTPTTPPDSTEEPDGLGSIWDSLGR